MRFEKKEDCYLDIKTGLEWSLDNYGLKMDWFEAMDFCQSRGNGWRLPAIDELLSLVDVTKDNLTTSLPGMVTSGYWSSTTDDQYTDRARGVYFGFGVDGWNYKSGYHHVRCVRGGTS